jgi:predicted nucleotidyltransferase
VRASLIERLSELFATDPRGVMAAYLFGSCARGDARADSDVDVAVLYQTRPASTLAAQPFDVEDDLRGALGRPVQVIVLNGASPDLVHRVLRDGIPFLDREPAVRIRFEVSARNAYFDLRPILLRYRQAVSR